MDFRLTSAAFSEGGDIPSRHTCDGEDISPPLSWAGVPDGTAELALVLEDPDARGFVHWVVAGIPPDASGLSEGELPPAAREGTNDFHRSGYGGPCPPSGVHRYVFTLHALSNPTQAGQPPSAEALRAAPAAGRASLTGRYARR